MESFLFSQKKLTSKNALPLVSAAIVECLHVCFSEDRMSQGLDVADVLFKCFEKAVSSHAQVVESFLTGVECGGFNRYVYLEFR